MTLTLGDAIKKVRSVLDVLEVGRVVRQLVVWICGGRVADEDAGDVVRELLGDLRVGG